MRERSVLFWDFDGVIKESVRVKSDAYERLFAPFGPDVAARVREHHRCHSGVSRFEKMPLYLEWAGRCATGAEISRYCELFSVAVTQAVVDAPWVPGAREYLEANYRRQRFVLITATPHMEIARILRTLGSEHWFREVHGAPVSKGEAVAGVLARWSCALSEALLIGDSASDYAAAASSGIDFLLRQTEFNQELQHSYSGPQRRDFVSE